MVMNKPKAIIFDWDNTLVNTWPIIHNALFQTFTEMGMTPWTIEQTKARVRRSMRDSFPELFGDKWEEASGLYQKHYLESHLEKLESLPDAVLLLDFFRTTGIYNVVVSNKKGPNLRKEAEHIGWSHYFNKIVGANDAAADKPSPAPVLMALEGSGITPDKDVWFIGDSVIDLECAKNAGCSGIIYGDITSEGLGAPKDGLYEGFPYLFQAMNHKELLAWVRKWF